MDILLILLSFLVGLVILFAAGYIFYFILWILGKIWDVIGCGCLIFFIIFIGLIVLAAMFL